MNKTDLRVIRSKDAINMSFKQLLKKKDFHKITVAEIAREANINRKTFYLHYSCMEDLLREFEDEQTDLFLSVMSDLDEFDVGMFIETLNQVLSENETFYRLISRTGRNSFFLRNCEKMVLDLLKQSLDEEISIEEEYQLKFVSIGIVGVYMDWLGDDESDDLDEIKLILSNILKKSLDGLID